MKRSALLSIVSFLVLALFSSCSKSSDTYEAFPCKVKGNDDWGLVKPDGKVLVAGEFSHRPSPVSCGRFWCQNAKGYWELYKADEHPSTVNDKEYRYVTNFYNGHAIVAERDQPVTIIDVDGNEVASLAKIGSLQPNQFNDFNDGLAVFSADTVQGVVDFNGEIVIPAKYYSVNKPSDGRIIALDSRSMAFSMWEDIDSLEESVATVFDYKGEKLFTISSKKYNRIGDGFINGYLPVGIHEGEKDSWGLMNAMGEIVVRPDASNCMISDVAGSHYIYSDDSYKYGLKSIETGTVIKAKYSGAFFLGENHIAVNEAEEGDDPEWLILNLDGTKAVAKKFMDVSPLFGDHVFVQVRDDRWQVIKLDGEMDADQDQFSKIEYMSLNPCYFVTSDHIDLDALIERVGMNANTMDSITFQSSVRTVLERQARYYSSTNKPVAANYSYTDEVNLFPTIEGEMVSETVTFPSKLSHQTYRQEKVIDYVWGNYYWYHMNKVPTGYVFTSKSPSKFTVTFNNYGKLRGKLHTLYSSLVKKFLAYGTEDNSNSGATLIDLGNGKSAVIALESNSVKVMWGNLSASEKSIFSYDGNKEDMKVSFAEDDFDEFGSECP